MQTAKKIVLASSSPRRKMLLKQLGLSFIVDQSDYKEDMQIAKNPHVLVKTLSKEKAKSVARNHSNALVIAADSIVVLKKEFLGKPKDKKEAKEMLRKLSGETHSIITGFTVFDTVTNKSVTKSQKTKIFMRKLSEDEVTAYLATGEPMDKAGAYGIQEKGAVFIEKIEGDFFNAVGLPLFSLARALKKFEVKVL